jgi:hypothetical protein
MKRRGAEIATRPDADPCRVRAPMCSLNRFIGMIEIELILYIS